MKRVKVEIILEVYDDCSLVEAMVRAGIKAKQLAHDAKAGAAAPLQLVHEGAVVAAEWLPALADKTG